MSVEEIYDIQGEKKIIQKCISDYGWYSEHNFYNYLYNAEKDSPSCFLRIDGKYGVFANKNIKTEAWNFMVGALAPEEKRDHVLMEAVMHCIGRGRKVSLEAVENDWRSIKKNLPDNCRAVRPSYVLYWPTFDMSVWDETLSGGEWKKMRNILNRFYREHIVSVVDCSSVAEDDLLKIIEDWIKKRRVYGYASNRKDSNREYVEHYKNFVKSKFEGVKNAKTLIVDGVPSTITCGWDIPNNNGGYYSAVGIFNYAFDGLSEAANIDDLKRLKKVGYSHVDFGGSPFPLLNFKKKFHYNDVYKTYSFSVVKK